MYTIVCAYEWIADAIIPPRARVARTRRCSLTTIPLAPTVHSLHDTSIVTLFDYKDPIIRDLIQSLKYDSSAHAATLCAEALAEYLEEEIASIRLFSTYDIFILPVPLHTSREHERGYNQITRILEQLPKPFRNGIFSTVDTGILARTRATPPQTKLSRRERLINVCDAFESMKTESVKDSYIFLIDDVTTTGATLLHAGTALEKCGATVIRIALARA